MKNPRLETHPFDNDCSYLDSELRWLKLRVSRILAEHELTDAQAEENDGDLAFAQRPGRVDSREFRCRAMELKEAEHKLRHECDVRLRINRERTAAHTLGLDELCLEYDLSSEERLVLLVALPFGISQSLAEGTLQDFARHWGSISVGDAISVLDPRSTGDWLLHRALFRPHAPLVSNGLIELDTPSGNVGPDTLPCADFRLTLDAFARITGDGEAITEGN